MKYPQCIISMLGNFDISQIIISDMRTNLPIDIAVVSVAKQCHTVTKKIRTL